MVVKTSAKGGHTTTHARPRKTTPVPQNKATAPKRTASRVKYLGDCPVCGAEGKLDVTPSPYRDWYVDCWSCQAEGLRGGDYLRAVAKAVDAPGGWDIKGDGPYWLADYIDSESSTDRPPAPLPTEAGLTRCSELLFDTPAALEYLRDERGLAEDTLWQERVGWNGTYFGFPIYNAEVRLVNWIRRVAPGSAGSPKYIVLGGRTAERGGVQLYPHVPSGSWLLVEGLIDALLLRQHGIPAVTGTHGVTTFLDEWLPLVNGRRIAVAYDVGAEGVQRERVAQLRAAGADAWAVDLSQLGLGHGGDTSDFLMGGGTADELVEFIKDERRRTDA